VHGINASIACGWLEFEQKLPEGYGLLAGSVPLFLLGLAAARLAETKKALHEAEER
jgi:hypothetical protein